MGLVRQVLDSLGIRQLEKPGVEADDVIGTLSRLAEEAGLDCVISTGDKDMAQLVSARTTLTNTMTGTDTDRAGVKSRFDVTPDQFVDFLALTGDKSDNIPGAPGIGDKTARKIIGATGVNPDSRVNKLTDDEVVKLRDEIEANYRVEGTLRGEIQMNIKRLMDIGCYRGLRHRRKLPCRGQNTKNNARTRKGPKSRPGGKKK